MARGGVFWVLRNLCSLNGGEAGLYAPDDTGVRDYHYWVWFDIILSSDGIIHRGAYVTNDNDGVGLISLITLSQLTRRPRNAAKTGTHDEQIVYPPPELLGARALRYDLPLGYIESPPCLRIIIVNSPKVDMVEVER
ncbi:hypothetical protein BDR06DRAFT_1006503 [Suillus hirtellus]|nr:hypothetical protein BDR06DRAFT_1006503 [Suillus hirtellus]